MTMAGGWLDKIKDLAKGNPQQAETVIEKVEDLVDKQTGGKYADQVDQGAGALREQLGLPAEQPAPEPTPTPAPEPTPTPASEPAPDRPSYDEPAPTTPAPNPSPATGDPQPSSSDGPLIPGEPQQPGQPGGPLDPGQLPGYGSGAGGSAPTGGASVPDPGPDTGETTEGTKELPPFGR